MLRAHPLGVFNQFAANNVRRNVRNDVDANALVLSARHKSFAEPFPSARP
jgi:hypothetical protein